ncbi:hypothetical protein [Pseudomonas sp. CM27]|uniref:hypothetical protein n=1 Tax=Pseudomonas sp. CM27 TaxID=2738452 RepID=UPI00155315E9|nr:hypothetical protein [Pseudomonas sp. CM27]NQD74970.1 hypothetical protein [Pseudomonas sp. CM27]
MQSILSFIVLNGSFHLHLLLVGGSWILAAGSAAENQEPVPADEGFQGGAGAPEEVLLVDRCT